MSNTIYLQAANGEIFQVCADDISCSGTIRNMLENPSMTQNDDSDQTVVYLEKVNSVILKKILKWAMHHKGDPTSCPTDYSASDAGTGIETLVDDWDAAYLENQNAGDLFELIVAADYLDIKRLLDMTAHKVVQMIRGKTIEEIRDAFNVKNDFSREEYEQILKENEWCERK